MAKSNQDGIHIKDMLHMRTILPACGTIVNPEVRGRCFGCKCYKECTIRDKFAAFSLKCNVAAIVVNICWGKKVYGDLKKIQILYRNVNVSYLSMIF